MKQIKSRRILALLLSLVMFVSLLPLQAFSEAELTEQTETIMEQFMETNVSDETTESDESAADEDEQTDENPIEERDDVYEALHEESAPTDSDESESEESDEPAQEIVGETEHQEEQDTEAVTEPDVTPDPDDELEATPQPSEEPEFPPEEVQDEIHDEDSADEPLIEPDDPTGEPADAPYEEPADENVDQEALPETEPTEGLPADEEADVQMTVADCIAACGHVYATTLDAAMVYADSAMLDEQHIFTISQAGALLLATAYAPETNAVKVWFMASDGEILTGYVHADVLDEIPVTDEQADEMANILWFDYADSEAGMLLVFVVAGEKPIVQEDQPAEESAVDELPIEGTTEETAVPETEAHAAAGDFLYVTTQTRVFMEVDDTAADDYYGDYFLGYFLKDAAVQVEDVLEDSFGRAWYDISYIYGPDEGDGLICEIIGRAYVLADETQQTDMTWRTATDYGYPPDYMRPMLLANFYMDLEDHYGGVASFYVGESGLHATTGHDNEYLQIARHDEYGTIFATPHYLKGETAYCLEHTQNSPVVRDHDSGPYTIVDLDGYRVTPGHSGYIFSDKTMHALAWVLRHTYPFMVLDRSDDDNEVWCRVAGQFAMREVVKQIEGDYYVRDYWEMDEFYRAYDQAPGVYLEYARWLAEEALDYVENIGSVTVADKSVRASGGQYIGTATLYTSADQMRISKSVGTVTGNSGGDDWEYYYLYSGDTVSITSSKSKFSVPIEIMPSSDDEACFYVGVTNSDIQKLFLPVYGDPYPILATTLEFDVPHGAASVTKKDAVSGSTLSGATFELLSGSTVIQTLTTGSGGTATFSNLTPGTYTIREKTAPQGYLNASPNTQTVTVTAGNTASVTFTNNRKTSKIRIQKTDQLTGQALAGAEFTITRLSAPAGSSGVGSVAAVITADANGTAETGWLEWGRFRITETKVPEDYQDSGYSVEIEAYENGKTYVIDVQNQPIPGYIQMTKTDVNRGTPLSGVQFDIYYNDAYGSGLAGTMTTNADGVARSGALRKGTYQVKEHANPEGYTGELVTLDAIVKPDETTYLSADNQPIQGKIRIQKSDQLTGEALAGAEFTITRLSSSSAAGDAGVGETVILTTDENGVAETGWLDYGTYEVRETKVPVHFVDNGFSQQIAVFEHEKTYTLDVENEPTKGYIQIVKTDALDQTPIEGVQFDIFYNDEYGEGLASTITTNADGVAVSEPLRKGKYIVREHANPTGYVSELVELHAEVKSDETTYLSADNQPIQGQIRIIKKDELTKEALAGAEFTITRISGLPSHKGADDGDVVAVITTDASGVALSPLLTWGTYTLMRVTDPNGQSVDYMYDNERRVIGASATVNGNVCKNAYSYENSRLKTVAHNTTDDSLDVTYTFSYDEFGNPTTLNLGDQMLSRNVYTTDGDRSLIRVEYGNGGKVSYTRDDFRRVVGIHYDNDTVPRFKYEYGANGQVAYVHDNELNRTAWVEYDASERLTRTHQMVNANDVSIGTPEYMNTIGYDAYGNVEYHREKVNDSANYETVYTYDVENRATQLRFGADNRKMTYVYDPIGRVHKREVVGATNYTTQYTYLEPDPEDSIRTTALVQSIAQNGQNFTYTYDNVGNIASVTRNGLMTTYMYDGIGQLIRVNDPHANKSTMYLYDRGGNLTGYLSAPYTEAASLDGVNETVFYTYDDPEWKDKVTAIGGKEITYDAIGNPLTYDGWTFTWKAGRMLHSMMKSGTNAQFTYDHNGLRIKKVVNDVTTNYVLNGKNIVHMKHGNNDLHFFYDAQGKPAMVRFNGTDYFYVYNLQGDVVAMIDAAGIQVVEYVYDAWGAPISKNGSMAATLGTVNPFRYRGYVYDEETGLYYLRSRYYNPIWKRFINADDLIGRVGNLLFHNQYAYCGNSAVQYSDDDGHEFAISLSGLGAAVAALAGVFSNGREAVAEILNDAYRKIQWVQQQRKVAREIIKAYVTAGIDSLFPKDNTVYVLLDTEEKVRYVGRTNNYARRMYQHKTDPKHPERATYHSKAVFTNLSVHEARYWEQTLISAYGLEALDNARREIAVAKLDGFWEEAQRAAEIFSGVKDDFFGLLGE